MHMHMHMCMHMHMHMCMQISHMHVNLQCYFLWRGAFCFSMECIYAIWRAEKCAI